MTIETLIDAVIDREGGYTNHPADRGGETRYGITIAVARANGYTGPMASLPRATAAAIYRSIYWTRPGFDLIAPIAPAVAAELFDTGINMGVSVAATFLQRALNALNRGATDYADMAVDGRAGPATRAAVAAFVKKRGSDLVLMKAMESLQGERYVSLAEGRPQNEAFLYGWLANRVGLAA